MALGTAPHQDNPQMLPSPATPTVSHSPRTTAEAEAIQQYPEVFKLRTPVHIDDVRTPEDEKRWREALARERVEIDHDQLIDPVIMSRVYGDRVDSFTEMRALALQRGEEVLAMAARARAAADTPIEEQLGEPGQGEPQQPQRKPQPGQPGNDQQWGNQQPPGHLGDHPERRFQPGNQRRFAGGGEQPGGHADTRALQAAQRASEQQNQQPGQQPQQPGQHPPGSTPQPQPHHDDEKKDKDKNKNDHTPRREA